MRERRILRTKDFMRDFLIGTTFDDWLTVEAVVMLANTWTLDGRVNREYFGDGEEPEKTEYSEWKYIRPVVYSLIKGRHTPLSFRFMFKIPGGETGSVFERVCRIRFGEGSVFVTSAVSMTGFVPDKEPERQWDAECSGFLSDAGIEFEDL